MFHTIVIGGGCLGASAAVSLQRKLNKEGKSEKVCLVEKAVLCAAESSRHSGIVRSAMLIQMLRSWPPFLLRCGDLSKVWGIKMEIDEFGSNLDS